MENIAVYADVSPEQFVAMTGDGVTGAPNSYAVANDIFKTAPLSLTELGICLVASLIVFHAVELEKWINTMRQPRGLKNAEVKH